MCRQLQHNSGRLSGGVTADYVLQLKGSANDEPKVSTRAATHPERHAVSQRQAGPDMSAALWATAGVEVTLCGWQVASNAVERHASVTATEVQLDAAALRQLAAMALGAADELDELAAEAACQH